MYLSLSREKLENKVHVTTLARLLLAMLTVISTKVVMSKASVREEVFTDSLLLVINTKVAGFKTKSMDLAK